MEEDAQQKIEVLSKRRCSKSIDRFELPEKKLINLWTIFFPLFFFWFFYPWKWILGPKLQPYIDWSRPMQHNRNTFQLTRRPRKRQLYHQKWKQFNSNDHSNFVYKSNGGYAIFWELERVDRQIQTLQSEISVLKQQLKIVQTGCVPSPPPSSSTIDKPNDSSVHLPGYFFCFFSLSLFLTLFSEKSFFSALFQANFLF